MQSKMAFNQHKTYEINHISYQVRFFHGKDRWIIKKTKMVTKPLLLGKKANSFLCVPNVGPLGWTWLGLTTYLYGGLGFLSLGSSRQSDSMR